MTPIDLLLGAKPMNLMDDETYCTVVLDYLYSTPQPYKCHHHADLPATR